MSLSKPAMVTIGTSGSGKTKLSAHVSGDPNTFVVREGFYSDTLATNVAEIKFLGGNSWIWVDGPGLEHSDRCTDPNKADAEHLRSMIKAIRPLTNVQALLLVIDSNVARFTPSHQQALKTYRDLFLGPSVSLQMLAARICIVFTKHVFGVGSANPREQELKDEFIPLINETLGRGAQVDKVFFVQLDPEDPRLMAGMLTEEQKRVQRDCTEAELVRLELVMSELGDGIGLSLQHLDAAAPIGQEERGLHAVEQIAAHYQKNLTAAGHHEAAVWNPWCLMKVEAFPPELMDAVVGSHTLQTLLLEKLAAVYQAAVAKQKETYNQKRNEAARVNVYDDSIGHWHVRCWHCDWRFKYKGVPQDAIINAAVQHRLNECRGWNFRKWQDEPDEAQQRDLRMQPIQFPQGKKLGVTHEFGDMVLQVASSLVQHHIGMRGGA